MLFKAEREKDAEKFKNGNEQYYLKVYLLIYLILIVQVKKKIKEFCFLF